MKRLSLLTIVLASVVCVSPVVAEPGATEELPPTRRVSELAVLPVLPEIDSGLKIEEGSPKLPGVTVGKDGDLRVEGGCFVHMLESFPVLTPDHWADAVLDVDVRTIRFGRDEQRPSLEIHDGWYTGLKRRTFTKRKFSVSLVPVARGPSGLVAYGYRTRSHVMVFVRVAAPEARGMKQCSLVGAALSIDLAASKGGVEESVEVNVTPRAALWMSASLTKLKSDREPSLSVSFAPIE